LSLSGSPASAISSEENGPSRVAALGVRALRDFATPTNGDVVLGKGAIVEEDVCFMGVAGASCGATIAWLGYVATDVFFPILSMAGSTKGCRACVGVSAVSVA
jgi:hypothetical protein